MNIFTKLFKRKSKIIKSPDNSPFTIDDIISDSEVIDVLDKFNAVKSNMDDVVIIYTTKDDGGSFHSITTPHTLETTFLWMLEIAKIDLLKEDED